MKQFTIEELIDIKEDVKRGFKGPELTQKYKMQVRESYLYIDLFTDKVIPRERFSNWGTYNKTKKPEKKEYSDLTQLIMRQMKR